MKRIFIMMSLAAVTSVSAQTTGELFLFSQSNFGATTARTAAMGGAYTSLGADIASMNINPAGLAMYRGGEVSISPTMRLGNSIVGYTGTADRANNNTSKFTVGNLGGVFTQGRITFGINYNRLADYYTNSHSYGSPQSYSITDMFAKQVQGIDSRNIGVPSGDIYRAFLDHAPVLWGAILGYQTQAIANSTGFLNYGSTVNLGSLINPSMSRRSDGALDEIAISAAYNADDKYYIGMTIGTQSLSYRRFDSYSELAELTATPTLDEVIHNRELSINGTGVNFKLGVTVRPLDWLRVGVSYHSPTWTSVNEEASENMSSYFFDAPTKEYYSDTPLYTSSYNTYSPSRLLGGASVTVADCAIISFDYKRTWYNGMGYTRPFYEGGYRPEVTATAVDNYTALSDNMSDSNGRIELNRIIQAQYGAVNTYSLGAEVNVTGGLFLRAGYLYQDSPYKSSALKAYGKLNQASAGIGYRNRAVSVDLAYINSRSQQLPYAYYSYENVVPTGVVTTENVIDNIILTFGVRF